MFLLRVFSHRLPSEPPPYREDQATELPTRLNRPPRPAWPALPPHTATHGRTPLPRVGLAASPNHARHRRNTSRLNVLRRATKFYQGPRRRSPPLSKARLRGEKEALEDSARGLQGELEAERTSAETAASEAMLMIERLQREKAAAQMEARQFKRYAEGRADHEREVQEEIVSLSDLAASYHSRLQSHGIDPDTFSDEEDEELYEEQRGHLEHSDLLSSAMVAPEEEANGGDLLSSAMDVKTD